MNKILTCIDRYVPTTSVLRNTENSINAIQKLYQQSLIFRDWIIKHAQNSEEYVVDDAMSNISENPVQNKVISNALEGKVNDNAFLTYYDINNIILDVFGF